MYSQKSVRVAILDLYEGQANQGMRCIRELLSEYVRSHDLHLELDEFEVRLGKNVPDLSYDIYISSGGPGSPLDSEGSRMGVGLFRMAQRGPTLQQHSPLPHSQTGPLHLPFLPAGMPPLCHRPCHKPEINSLWRFSNPYARRCAKRTGICRPHRPLLCSGQPQLPGHTARQTTSRRNRRSRCWLSKKKDRMFRSKEPLWPSVLMNI